MNSPEITIISTIESTMKVDIEEAKRLIEQGKQHPSYLTDRLFYYKLESQLCIYYTMSAQYNLAITHSQALSNDAINEKLWSTESAILNTLAIAYTQLGILDKAFETFQKLIRISIDNNFPNLLSYAYNNIGFLYKNLFDYQHSITYFEMSVETILPIKDDYKDKAPHLIGNLIIEYCRNNMFDKAEYYLSMINENFESNDKYSQSSILEANMVYNIKKGNFDKAKTIYASIRTLNIELGAFYNNLHLLATYCELCKEHSVSYDYYIPFIIESIDTFTKDHGDILMRIYRVLLDYYTDLNDTDACNKLYPIYIYHLEQFNKKIRQQQLSSINLLSEVEETKIENKLINEKNIELKRLKDEAEATKQELSRAYDTLQSISKIGREVTANLQLENVVTVIYKHICAAIPVTSFLLMIYNEEESTLDSVLIYENDTLLPNISIDINNQHSILAKVFRDNDTIITNDINSDSRINTHIFHKSSSQKIKSAMFFNLHYNEKIVGVCSIQHSNANSYTQEHYEFLELLRPYLAIALMNANRSEELQKEINSRRQTQLELKALNQQLQQMANIDSLTGINNRRFFDSNYNELFKNKKTTSYLAIFMIDIDFFKRYNDYFGHIEGDNVLIEVAKAIHNEFSSINGLSARFGGEEFIGLAEVQSLEQITKIGNSLINTIQQLKIPHPNSVTDFVSISIGISYTTSNNEKYRQVLINYADDALYEAKNKGRNQYIIKAIV